MVSYVSNLLRRITESVLGVEWNVLSLPELLEKDGDLDSIWCLRSV
jgi:hypothetical protein